MKNSIEKEKITTVIFDIDGTLSPDVSWFKLTSCLGASVETHARIFKAFQNGDTDYVTAKKALIELWRDTGRVRRVDLQRIFEEWSLKKEAQMVVSYLRTTYNLCLISWSLDLYVASVAERLGIDDYFANTELVFDDSGELVDFHYHTDQSAKKLEHFRKYAQARNVDTASCVIIWNWEGDLGLFQELSYGIWVDTDLHPEIRKLSSVVIQNLDELRFYL